MSFSVTPMLIMEAAKRRGWSVRVIDEGRSFYRLDTPKGDYYYIRNITSVKSHAVNGIIAGRKDLFYTLAADIGIRVPATLEYSDDTKALADFLKTHGRLVVKPVDQAHGNGITTDICDQADLEEAVAFARKYGNKVLVQQHVVGDDYRVLIIGDKLAAAAIRKPAYVVGDGEHTVAELITLENQSDRRSAGYSASLTHIDASAAARYLGAQLQHVPTKGEEVRVVGTANIGKGGVSLDVTDTLDPQLVAIARKVTGHFGIGLCGVDFLVTPEGEPYVIEINTGPSLGLHEYPFQGKPRQTPDAFLDWLTRP